jgi:hypothetical protein
LPAGFVTITAVKNLSQLGGGVFNYIFGGAADTFGIEVDRAGASRQIPFRFQGCAITQALFRYERAKRLSFGFQFQASRWEEDPAGTSLADPAVGSTPFMAFSGDWYLQDLAAPAAPVVLTVKKVEFQFAPKLIPELGSRGLDGSFSNLAGSDIAGWTRDELDAKLKLTITYPSSDFYDDVVNDSHKQLLGKLYPGKPGRAVAAARKAVWLHDLVLDAEPKPVEADGQEALELVYNIGRDPALGIPPIVIGMHAT